ncbi:hypothetical protein GCM10010082_16410 [Kushneria pakistanensis]|uniref:Ubiquinone biosynthesis accessory factor UbiK n=1 Tax=Kushneria pakistanensis TaxID=1508770 RepID=A0ABQ3FHX3_9GAMM|nr:hypothetical protein GCM10010082_16410 [Kushneria pakistanensis]
MAKHDIFGRLAQQVGERLQDVSRGPEEIQRTVQSAMRSAFDRMELVSREDFDVMMEVLQRTRSRVEALEKQVTRLEAALDERDGKSAAGAPSEMSAAAAPGGASTTAEAERLAGEHDAPAAPIGSSDKAGGTAGTDTTGTVATHKGTTGSATSGTGNTGAAASKPAGKSTRGSGKRASGSDDQSGQGTAD